MKRFFFLSYRLARQTRSLRRTHSKCENEHAQFVRRAAFMRREGPITHTLPSILSCLPVRLGAAAALVEGRGCPRWSGHPLPRPAARVAAAEAREAALDVDEACGAVGIRHAALQLARVQSLGLAHGAGRARARYGAPALMLLLELGHSPTHCLVDLVRVRVRGRST